MNADLVCLIALRFPKIHETSQTPINLEINMGRQVCPSE